MQPAKVSPSPAAVLLSLSREVLCFNPVVMCELGITMVGDARRYEHLRVDDVIFVANDGQVGKQEPPTFTTSVSGPRVFNSQVLSTTLHVDVEGADDEEGVARIEVEQKKGQPRAKIERRKCER